MALLVSSRTGTGYRISERAMKKYGRRSGNNDCLEIRGFESQRSAADWNGNASRSLGACSKVRGFKV